MQKKRRLSRCMQRVPIRWRLALVSLGLLVLLLSALGIIVSFIAEQALVTNEVNVLHNEAQVALKGVTKDLHQPQQRPFGLGINFLPSAAPVPGFDDTARSLLHALTSPSTSAVILTTTGTPLITNASSSFDVPGINIASSQVQQIIKSNVPYLLAKDNLGQHQLVVFIPLVKNFHTTAILQVSTPTAPIDDFLTTFHLILFLGIMCTFSIAIALIFPLVSIALRPLVEIERTSRQIAQGELSIRIDQPPTDDEIGRLARSFNAMVARLETAFQKQKRFVGDVSHELRTPLTVLNGNLEMLLLGVDRGDREITRHLARGMFAEVRRMHRMVEDLLALTRLDEGRLVLRKDTVTVDTLLHTVCEQANHLAHGQEIRCLIEPGLPAISADRDRLQQILLNLVDNALKYTPLGGQIELHVLKESQRTVALTINDTGQGISPEALPHVFDRFYRADPSRSRSSVYSGGSGLGLAIAKELVEAQHGTIEISSTLGKGTSVTLRFPALVQLERAKRHELPEMKG
ncbi:sensor histidine kinase [Ktedonobacter racemifer]|uniref:histidine kinase n=1 Tax=Ktedonobacter racemifer DSM 44963 TaxID=485913 RepID=D6TQD1_KTERA|nr:ATP-binding protein [Ktedonobacter racemifer]EFH85779.1 integral membrane sensor signal transduction histidine kinase [Ktedonobacter racemifer DSM 44963]